MQMNPVVLLQILVMSHFLLFPEKMSSFVASFNLFLLSTCPFHFLLPSLSSLFLPSPFSVLFVGAKFMSPLVPLILSLLYFAILFTASLFLMLFLLPLALKSPLNRSIGLPFPGLSSVNCYLSVHRAFKC